MAGALASPSLTAQEKLSVLVNVSSEIPRDDHNTAPVCIADVENRCLDPGLKLQSIGRLNSLNKEDEAMLDENGRSEKQKADKKVIEDPLKVSSKVRQSDNSFLREEGNAIQAQAEAKAKLASTENPDTADVDELTKMHLENVRLANILCTLLSASDAPSATEADDMRLTEMVLNNDYS